mgnify:CR=1 FL=1
MPSKTKIEKYNLNEEVIALKKAGMSNEEIARTIRSRYNEIEELQNLSAMSIKRFFEKYFSKDYEEKIKDYKFEGEDSVESIYKEFKRKMRSLYARIESRNLQIKELWDKAIEKKDIDTLYKLQKALNDNERELRQQMLALIQYSDERISPLVKMNEKKEIKINNLLLNFSSALCPVCKKRINNILSEIEYARRE